MKKSNTYLMAIAIEDVPEAVNDDIIKAIREIDYVVNADILEEDDLFIYDDDMGDDEDFFEGAYI